MKINANNVVTINPVTTGIRFFLASSKGDTLHTAATGINAHGIRVPPPIHMVQIWPKAVKVDGLIDNDEANSLADDPTKERPEKPEPSSPVNIPTPETVSVATNLFNGTAFDNATPKSFIIPWDNPGSGIPRMLWNPLPPK